MIYLIGGTSRVGKSTLAQIILERNSISSISSDVIRNLLDSGPTKLGIAQLEENKRTEVFSPYFVQFLKILQNRYSNYVVEGDIFTPEQVSLLQEKITLKCCFLGMSATNLEDLKKTDHRLNWIQNLSPEEKSKLSKSIVEGNWVSRLPEEEQAAIPQKLVQLSKEFEVAAAKYRFPYFDIYPDREKALESAYSALMF